MCSSIKSYSCALKVTCKRQAMKVFFNFWATRGSIIFHSSVQWLMILHLMKCWQNGIWFWNLKKLPEYTKWLKSDPGKSVWSAGCTWHSRSSLRKEFVQCGYGVLFRKIKQRWEGNWWTTLSYSFLTYHMVLYK